MAELYVYVPIQTDATRILELHPAPRRADPLQITLREISLEPFRSGKQTERSLYEALSYVWGARTGQHPIFCGGKRILVTANCATAMRYLRRKKRTRQLWIDTISINQASDQEKSQQVRIMGEIYRSATRVMMWLGEDEALTAKAFIRLRVLAYGYGVPETGSISGKVQMWLYQASDKLLVSKDQARKLESGEDGYFLQLFENPYFRRVWTIQETLATQNVTVTIGRSTIPWRCFMSGMLGVISQKAHNAEDYYATLPTSETDPFMQRVSRHLRDDMDTIEKLGNLARIASKNECSDPRDRVFALRGLFREVGIRLPNPDYGLSVAEVYAEATRAIIMQTNSLSIWDTRARVQDMENLPSWAVDFSQLQWNSIDRRGKASNDTSVNYGLISNQPLSPLHLRGAQFDTITRQGAQSALLNTDQDSISEMSRTATLVDGAKMLRGWLEAIPEPLSSLYPDSEETYLSVLFHCLADTRFIPDPLAEASQRQVFDDWTNTVLALKSEPIPPEEMEPHVPTNMDPASFITDEDAMLVVLLDTQPDRFNVPSAILAHFLYPKSEFRRTRFFITDKGYIGIALTDVRIDDQVVILAGATLPMIVRPDGDFFKFVCPAYVYGIMDGEAWPDDESEIQTFLMA